MSENEEIEKALNASTPDAQDHLSCLISRLIYWRDDMRDPNGSPDAWERAHKASADLKEYYASLLRVVEAARSVCRECWQSDSSFLALDEALKALAALPAPGERKDE